MGAPKVLITGPRGYLAKNLICEIAKHPKFNVVTLDRGQSIAECFAEHSRTPNPIRKVVHLATQFLKNHEPAQIEPLIQSNLTLTTELLEASLAAKIDTFIAFGTYYEFPKPASLYAATKAAQNPILDFYASQGLPVTCLYLYDTYGPADPRPKLINLLIQALRTGEPLGLSPGLQKMKLLHVEDVVRAILNALEMGSDAPPAGPGPVRRYAVEPLEAPTLQEIAALLEKKVPRTSVFQWGARGYTPGVQMDPKIPYPPLPGFKAQITLDQGLGELLKSC